MRRRFPNRSRSPSGGQQARHSPNIPCKANQRPCSCDLLQTQNENRRNPGASFPRTSRRQRRSLPAPNKPPRLEPPGHRRIPRAKARPIRQHLHRTCLRDHLALPCRGIATASPLPQPRTLGHRKHEPPPTRYRLPGGRLLEALRPRPGKQHRLQQPCPRNHPHCRLRPRPRRNRTLRVASRRCLEAEPNVHARLDPISESRFPAQPTSESHRAPANPFPTTRPCARNSIQHPVAHSDQSTTGQRQTGSAPLDAFQGAHGSDDRE